MLGGSGNIEEDREILKMINPIKKYWCNISMGVFKGGVTGSSDSRRLTGVLLKAYTCT